MNLPRRPRRQIAWELVGCGYRGHHLPASDAAELRAEHWPLGYERDGVRWCRCLRCDTWLPMAPPTRPARPHPPERSEIEIPARGHALRDKIILRLIAVDERFAMRADELERAIVGDRREGGVPCCVVATAGTTSTNAFDPVQEIGEVCRRHGAWLHVDAAMSGTAAVCPELRFVNLGLEAADSYCVNPHKWMFVNFDCDAFYVADRSSLLNALSILPEYLRNPATEAGAVIDYRDWQVPLGRRFRALKLWATIRCYGAEGLRRHVREHVRLAQELAGWIREDPDFELAAPVPLNLVCFRHRAGDAVNQAIMDRLNRSGELFLTHMRLDGRLVLRLSVGGTWTGRQHVVEAWDAVRRAAEEAA